MFHPFWYEALTFAALASVACVGMTLVFNREVLPAKSNTQLKTVPEEVVAPAAA